MSRADWIEDAACTSVDGELFFSDDASIKAEALRVCRGCPVRTQCLADALDAEGSQPYSRRSGIFGGRTVAERVRLSEGKPLRTPGHAPKVIPLIRAGLRNVDIARELGIHPDSVARIRTKYARTVPA
jgi:WhiB family transcriptional regulator, redox-sensing transcriptional regulator